LITNNFYRSWIVTPKEKRDLLEKQKQAFGGFEEDREELNNEEDFQNAEQKIMGKKNPKKSFGGKKPYKKFKKTK